MEHEPGNTPRSRVLDALAKIRRTRLRSAIVENLIISFSAFLFTTFLTAILEMSFSMGRTGRGALFFTALVVSIYPIVRYLLPEVYRYFAPPATEELLEIALITGETHPEVKDRLRNAIELMSKPDEAYHSKELADAYVEQVFQNASDLDLGRGLSFRLRKSPKAFLAAAVALSFALLALFPSEVPSALARIVDFTHKYSLPEAYLIKVYPGDTRLSRGDTLKVTVTLNRISAVGLPNYVLIHEKYTGEMEFETHRGRQTAEGAYSFSLPNVRGSLDYYVTARDQSTSEYRVSVVDLPIVQRFAVRLVYPSYTGMSPEKLQENIGDFSALVGTKAEFSLVTNKELLYARIAFGDSTNVPLATAGNEASGHFQVRRSEKYRLRVVDSDSLSNRDPITYSINALADEYPVCEITYPGKDVDLNRDMQLPLRISISDDYGFTRLILQYRLISSKFASPDKDYHSIEIPLPSKTGRQQDISYTWDLTSLGLVPEDVVSYHARVFDNDVVNGPKSSVSAEYTLRLPSMQEVFAAADSEHSDLMRNTKDILNQSDELKDQLDRFSEEMKTATKQMSWEQEKKTGNTLQRYDSLQKKIENVKKQLENMTQKMLENKMISPNTLEKYLELQKALQEINSPEFQDALKKLQQAIQSLNPNMVRQALQNFQLNEDMLRKSIERTLSLIKRVQIEQKFDELTKRVDKMTADQDSLRNSTINSDSRNGQMRNRLSERQEDIQKELSESRRVMSELREKMDEFRSEMPMKQMKGAEESLDSSQVGSKMQESESQLSQGNFSKSMSTQRQISSALENFRQQLDQAERAMLQNQQKATVDALRKAQQNLLDISKEQEELKNQSEGAVPHSADTRNLAEKQNELIQQLGYTSQQMMQLSNKSFAVTPDMGRQMGEAYNQMQRAMNNLQSRNGDSPTGPQGQAMGAMNKAVLSIQATLESMMQGQSGGGFPSLLQQLQQLAGKQEGLNALTSQLGQQGELSIQQQAELARLAAQQEAIRKSLEELAKEAGQSRSPNRALGDLNQIAKEMGDVAKDLGNRNITQETIRRQDKILAHLLDASRSLRQRDYDNRRVTKTGTDVMTASPGELNLSNSASEEEQELLRLIKANFPPEYQEVIMKYYRLLKKTPE